MCNPNPFPDVHRNACHVDIREANTKVIRKKKRKLPICFKVDIFVFVTHCNIDIMVSLS